MTLLQINPRRRFLNASKARVSEGKQLVAHRLKDHFGELALEDLVVLRHDFSIWMRVDVQAEIARHFSERPEHQFSGARLTSDSLDFRFPHLLEDGDGAIAVAPPVYSLIDLGDGETAQTLLRGLWLDTQDDVPYVVMMELCTQRFNQELRVEIAVPPGIESRKFAQTLLECLIRAGDEAKTHRGRVLLAHDETSPESIDFRRLPITPIGWDDVVLDERTIDLFNRNTLGFIKQAQALSKLGFSSRKGILLYGPPGTGKTSLIRCLVSQLESHTRFILTPDNLSHLTEIMQAARKMLPALVVIEDVDLIAEDRGRSGSGQAGLLNCLLNEMDGLSADSQILFLLTTNRPEALEPALASRPGRIDQVIEVALPGERERRQLLAKFTGSVAISELVIARVSKKTDDASPAFLKELVRRAVQVMLEANQCELELLHFDGALQDMVQSGGDIGSRLLGGKAMGFT